MNIETELNKKQKDAVTTSSKYVRIIAGAGSGKTRVLTYRIAYLLQNAFAEPWDILAFTFTNKVAKEMNERVYKLIPDCQNGLTIKTFHSFAVMFLRREIYLIDYPSNFTILDDEDQTTLIKDICAAMGYKKKDPIVKMAQAYIGRQKLKEIEPEDCKISNFSFPEEKECIEIYTRYEEEKEKMKCLDFDDLLLKTNYILENYPEVRIKWKNAYKHILIDEFQDTNNTEFKMVKYLMNDLTNLYVVGDPDQTIYTWRGANQNIILEMNKTFGNIDTIILDCNYRSTQVILDSANKLIAYNKMRIKKDLYTEQKGGDPITVFGAGTTQSEGDYIAREIKRLVQYEGYEYKDIVVLYRSSYVTKDIETALNRMSINYIICGGLKFFERKEIKDVLAYFRLLVNPLDDISFKRICNVPRRGLGDAALETLFKEAEDHEQSLYNYVKDVDADESNVPNKALNSLKIMVELLEQVKVKLASETETYSKVLEDMITSLGYYSYLSDDDDGQDRTENVKELFEDIRHFARQSPDSKFDEYLQNITLNSAQDDVDNGEHVTLMTIHTAKGLEFPVVFVVRLNEGVFPSNHSIVEGGFEGMEEERRLAYVAMTRAKQKLYLTLSGGFSYVVGTSLVPSRFLFESGNTHIVKDDYNPYKSSKTISNHHIFNDGPHYDPFKKTIKEPEIIEQPKAPVTNGITDWKVGDIVIHRKLGKGVVIALEHDDIIKVNFEEHGIKSILGNHIAVSKGDK